ncbi:MAG: hypothetical protein MJY99_07340 [Fibrobacter sp.]|nr:hypothetical protein [Fibrobacter sp.]
MQSSSCIYNLDEYNTQIILEHSGTTSLKYSGHNQYVTLQWWVGENSPVSKCSSTAQTSEDSLQAVKKIEEDSLINNFLQKYIDLDTINSTTILQSDAGKFKISKFPDFSHNMVYILVEPDDGKKLDNYLYAGNSKIHLNGWSSQVKIQRKSRFPIKFEILSRERRKIKIKWWVGTEEPTETLVNSSTYQTNNIVHVSYDFPKNSKSATLSLTFNKNDFKDGNIPRYKKFSKIPPQAAQIIKDAAYLENVYDIHAEPKEGKWITVAIPIDTNNFSLFDSLHIAHYIEKENHWDLIAPDSIVNGFAYFKTDSFSPLSGLWSGVKTFVSHTVDRLTEVHDDTYEIVTGGIELIGDKLYEAYDSFTDMFCGKGISRLPWETESYDRQQGSLNVESIPQDTIFEFIKDYSERNLQPFSNASTELKYADYWNYTKYNLDIILADLIYSKIDSTRSRRFSFEILPDDGVTVKITDSQNNSTYDFSAFFQTSDVLLEDAQQVVKVGESFFGATNIDGKFITNLHSAWESFTSGDVRNTCKEWLTGFGLVDWSHDLFNSFIYNQETFDKFVSNGIRATATWSFNFNPYQDLLSEKDDWLQDMTAAMVRISILAWLDKIDFREIARIKYAKLYDGMQAWLNFAAPIYGYNNLAISAYGSLALYEFIFRSTENNLKEMNKGLNRHYGPNGGYSEGTGYSQYIWDELAYVIVALQQAYKDEGKILEISENFLKSGKYMAEISRPVDGIGLIPVEIDDGCTYNPDYLVWSSIYNNVGDTTGAQLMAALAAKWYLRDTEKQLPMRAIGIPELFKITMKQEKIKLANIEFNIWKPIVQKSHLYAAYSNPDSFLRQEKNLHTTFKDGIGLITAVVNEDTVALSIIAENGTLWKNGNNHDQQDNLSITLTSSKKGFIVQDRGYSGYNIENDLTKRFYDHNVVTSSNHENITTNTSMENPSDIICTNYGSTFEERIKCIDQNTESKNKVISSSYLAQVSRDLTGDRAGGFWYYGASWGLDAAEYLGADLSDFRESGGAKAQLVRVHTDDEIELASISAYHASDPEKNELESSGAQSLKNYRTIMYFDKAFWIIDRPNITGTVWMINARHPWSKLNFNIYTTNDFSFTDPIPAITKVYQKNNRSDYSSDTGGKFNLFYWYTLHDKQTHTYVAKYALGESSMTKTNENCYQDYQCFESKDRKKRMIVPPQNQSGENYPLNQLFPYLYTNLKANGIVLGTLEGATWKLKAIDGYIYTPTGSALDNIVTYLQNYYYIDPNTGVYNMVDESIPYSPAIPILLLR